MIGDQMRFWSRTSRRFVGCVLLLVAAVGAAIGQRMQERPAGAVVEESFDAPSLRHNLLGDPSRRSLSIYLPPGYEREPKRRYPCIYLLHGYQGSYKQWMAGGAEWNIRDVMDRAIRGGAVRDLIVVMPDGTNAYGGGFYTNSMASGNCEDYIADDVVAFVDAKYRTIARPSARAVAGHSMGGYGAIRLAMKRPDRFGAMYALSPACLGWAGDLSTSDPAWKVTLRFRDRKEVTAAGGNYLAQAFLALGAAWSPDPARPPFLADLPVMGAEMRRDEGAVARWSANMPVAMVDQYRSNLARLRAIAFDAGNRDQFTHIPLTCRQLSEALRRNGIQHRFEEYDGDHNDKVPARLEDKMLPVLSAALTDAGD
jgi:S-formylglutathione hydrolase FrmB